MKNSEGWPFVSIVLAVRNGERFLAEAMRSVLAQNYPQSELIVVDGHSTDRTAEIAQSFSGVRFFTQPGGGLPAALNFGITGARGDWIALLEHDDIWTPEKLWTQITFMLTRPELQFTMTRARFFLEPGCAWPSGYNPDWLKQPQFGAILSSFVARKSAFEQVGKFDERLKYSGDMDWFARAKDLRVPMAYLEETLLLKRVHDRNVTGQTQLNNAELLEVIKRKLDRKRTTTEAAQAGLYLANSGARASARFNDDFREDMAERELKRRERRAPSASEVSVIIPAFNAERYLAVAIESVLAQTIRPMEIIVVDDGSTDRTAQIAEQFGAPVICHRRPHAGIAATRNFGISVARGNWLAFLDADDLWTHEKLERQLAAAKKDSALEMIFGGVRQFVSPELSREDQSRLSASPATSAAPHAGTMLARRAVFEHVGRFDETLKIAEFIEWFARTQNAGARMTTLPEIVLQRRRHLSNTTLKQKNSLTDMTLAMKRILDRRRESMASLQA